MQDSSSKNRIINFRISDKDYNDLLEIKNYLENQLKIRLTMTQVIEHIIAENKNHIIQIMRITMYYNENKTKENKSITN